MAKFSIAYVKQHPVMFGGIVVVFGLLFWLLMNKGGSSGSAQVVTTGPSEALQAAQLSAGVAIQSKQLDASVSRDMAAMQLEAMTRQLNGQSAIAAMEYQYRMIELDRSSDIATLQIGASLQALTAQLNNSLAIVDNNNSHMLDMATAAYTASTTQTAINAALQRAMSGDQLEAFKYGTRYNAIAFAPEVDRDNMLALMVASENGNPLSYYDAGSGTFRIN